MRLLLISIIGLTLAGCATFGTDVTQIDYVEGDLEIISSANGGIEYNQNDVVIDIDPGLVGQGLPNIDLRGSAAVGIGTFHVGRVGGNARIILIGNHNVANDLAAVLDALPIPVEGQQ